jgi:DNA-directed RNA polymerase subunit M/transcription elongation factor TFIIS
MKKQTNKKYINLQNEISPFHNSLYNFITENSVDIKEAYIKYAENTLNRAKNQIDINNIILNFDYAIQIELSIFEYVLTYCLNNTYNSSFIKPIYDDKMYNILLNLDPNSNIKNKTFKKNILTGKINPRDVAFMSPSQIHPEKWRYWVNKKEYKDFKEKAIEYSTAHKCTVCGETKCTISQGQTSSIDDTTPTYANCVACYNIFQI